MATIRKSITFTKHQENWIKLQVEEGLYTNESEYIRDLIRKDQKSNLKFENLKKAIQKGLDSGVSQKSILDIVKDIDDNFLIENGKL
ncbi:type II toxin-antitoxin system ParD family antitoxin [Flavobacteriaceae bacterium 14752]|uniref:type II toxin-antitoxin system ParD family antitoxin n=1 Tax=Mesohalobacter salilacus TaxID=2491711 RepID=UPI000F6402D0|nr:type II toxin-antitoxin system ParD family antitoxin [Flavobacteriaceae bacterium 14752]